MKAKYNFWENCEWGEEAYISKPITEELIIETEKKQDINFHYHILT